MTEEFKNKFPSLPINRAIILWESGEWTREYHICRDDDTAFSLCEIKAGTIDKQRLKEAINKIWKTWEKYEDVTPKSDMYGALCFMKDLKKELGLLEEKDEN